MNKPLSWQPNLVHGSGPLYIALSDQMARDIAAGRLVEGTCLPPQRALAWALGVTHGTITRTYERAEKMGLIRAEVGRGTYVAPRETPPSPLMPQSGDVPELDLARNFPFPHLDPDLGDAFRALADQPGLNNLLNYTPIEGMLRHREAGQHLFRQFNIEAPIEQLLMTSGAQHALQVLLQGLFKEGDALAVEAINYPGLISAAPRLGIRLVPIDSDQEGMHAGHLDEVCRKRPIAGLVIAPNVHNPTGRSTSKARLSELAACAERHDLHVIEDDPYSSMLSSEKQSIWHLLPERTSCVATASKVIGGGLRIGFICAPELVRSSLVRTINDISSMASPIGAELARHWIMSDRLAATVQRKRMSLAHRHRMVANILGKQVELYPDRVFAWLHLPVGINPAVFELEAARRGVAILGAHHFVVGATPVPSAVRLALGALPSDEQFKEALNRVRRLIEDLRLAL